MIFYQFAFGQSTILKIAMDTGFLTELIISGKREGGNL